MNKHTPGPWMVSFDATRYSIYQCDVIDGSPYRRTPIAFVPKIASAHACDEAERRMILQDAHLIAAAPTMYEALRKIAAIEDKMVVSDWEEIEEARGIARAAIAKAEGT